MKSLIRSMVVAGALAIPAFAFAQANDSAVSQGAAATAVQQGDSGYGGSVDGSSAAGAAHHHWYNLAGRGKSTGSNSQQDKCVGPVSFCNIYFGS
ncbi:hypothetical protein [Paraburkholderia solisilvae]|uniref:Uncharacterized protein n=1 Tax=Paraburkholderia solisilvae TaxID=624376 RepID=A0A6J5CVV1_9BURK|nr:hypothetical protein [Paraburkholderia solisilvae]CAB3746108.1 hypothetical protein LMG29739_00103 [Paraburkholderia solisilvae]